MTENGNTRVTPTYAFKIDNPTITMDTTHSQTLVGNGPGR